MTEAEWLACEDAVALTTHVTRRRKAPISHRKLLLLVHAVLVRFYNARNDSGAPTVLDYFERRADFGGRPPFMEALVIGAMGGSIGLTKGRAQMLVGYFHRRGKDGTVPANVSRVIRFVAQQGVLPASTIPALIRCVTRNPFRAVAFAPEWRTDTVRALAAQMYESRDFSAMPILADALQDAGCDTPDILAHCRDAARTHVRGCWVVDLVLGKE